MILKECAKCKYFASTSLWNECLHEKATYKVYGLLSEDTTQHTVTHMRSGNCGAEARLFVGVS